MAGLFDDVLGEEESGGLFDDVLAPKKKLGEVIAPKADFSGVTGEWSKPLGESTMVPAYRARNASIQPEQLSPVRVPFELQKPYQPEAPIGFADTEVGKALGIERNFTSSGFDPALTPSPRELTGREKFHLANAGVDKLEDRPLWRKAVDSFTDTMDDFTSGIVRGGGDAANYPAGYMDEGKLQAAKRVIDARPEGGYWTGNAKAPVWVPVDDTAVKAALKTITDVAVGTAERNRESQQLAQEYPVGIENVEDIDAAKGLLGKGKAMLMNPIDTFTNKVVPSMVSSAPVIVASAMSRNPMLLSALGGGSTAYAQETATGVSDYLAGIGVDTSNPDAVEAALNDQNILTDALQYTEESAGIVGGASLLSGGLAGKSLAPSFVKGALPRAVSDITQQTLAGGVIDAAGEAGKQVRARGDITDPESVLLEGFSGGVESPVSALGRITSEYQNAQDVSNASTEELTRRFFDSKNNADKMAAALALAQRGEQISNKSLDQKLGVVTNTNNQEKPLQETKVTSPPLGEATAVTPVTKATAPPAVEPTQDLDAMLKDKFTSQGQTDETGRLDQANTNAETTPATRPAAYSVTKTSDTAPSTAANASNTLRKSFAQPDDVAASDFVSKATELGVAPEVAQVLSPKAARDDVTGFPDGRGSGVKSGTMQRAIDHVKETGEESHFVSADIFNLGGLNKHHGDNSAKANADYKAMANILSDELTAAGADVVPMRTGGDEFGVFAVNVPQAKLDAAIESAQAKITAYAEQNGLSQVVNPKGGETGVGVHMGSAAISPESTIDEVFSRAEYGVNQSKLARANNVNRSETGTTGPIASQGQARGTVENIDGTPPSRAGESTGRTGEASSDAGKRRYVQKVIKGKPVTRPGKNGKPVPVMVPTIDYKNDTLIHWLGAAGGINFDNVGKQIGIDKALFKDRLNRPFGIAFPVLRRNGGMTLDEIYEKMKEDGWLLPDSETGQARDDASAMEDMLMDALAGRPVYHPYEGRATRDSATQDARQAEPSNFATADELAQEEGFENANEREAFELYVANALDREQDIDADRYEEIYEAAREIEYGTDTERAGTSEADSGRLEETTPARTGLFAQATTQETVEAERRKRDADRDGRTGSGRTDMLSGDGELFAGKRPDQSDLGGSNYSLSAGSTNGLSNQEVVRVAVRILGENPDQGVVPVLVVDSTEQLPQAIRDDMEANDIPAQEVRGVHWRGKSYLVADKLTTEAEVEEVIFHEHYTHGGLRAKYGNRLNDVLAGLVDGVGGLDGLRKLASGQKIDLSLYEETVLGNLRIAQKFQVPYLMEELLAHMSASTGKLRRVIQEYVGAIRAWLRSNKFPGLSEYGVTDLANVLKQAREATLEKAASNSSRPFYQRVFHGTPHKVDKFSLQKIGTGEGAQAFGWGLYFTGKREIAEYYKHTTAIMRLTGVDGKKYGDSQEGAENTARALLSSFMTDRKTFDGYNDGGKSYMGKIARDIKKGIIKAADGNVYSVEIPEDSDLMDWDKPLSEQPEKAQPVLRSMWHKAAKSFSQIDKNANPSVGQIHHLYTQHRGGNAKAFADEMNDAGVVGLKYLDGNSRGIDEGKTSNYVIWDEAAIGEPEAMYSRSSDDQTDTPEFKAWFGDSKVVDADGKPLVVYHGTANPWTEMRTGEQRLGSFEKLVKGSGIPKDLVLMEREIIERTGAAVWMTDSEYVADGYRDSRDGETMAVYVSIQNPLDLRSDIDFINKVLTEAYGKEVEVNDEYGYEKGIAHAVVRDNSKVIKWARENGYDGLIYPDTDITGRYTHTSYVALNPGQIKSATGNSGAFDAGNPDIRYSRKPDEARADAEAKRTEAAESLPANRGTAGWNYDASRWDGRKGWLRKQRADLQDKMVSWKYLQEDLNKVIPDAENVYRLETLMHGRVADRMDTLERESIVPLVEAMRRAKVDVAALEQYLYARHAQERNEHIADINPSMPDYGSGMGTDEATKILADAKPAMATLAKQVDKMLADTRRRMLDAGLITQEQFNSLNSQYKHYIPLRGKKTEANDFDADMRRTAGGGGVDTRGSMLKTAMGRGKGNLAENLLAEVIGDAQRSIIMAEKARVGRAVMRVVLANPNPALWEVEPVQTERKLDANGEVYEAVINDWSDPRVIAVKHKGQLYKVSIADEQLAKALNHVGVEKLGEFTRIAGKMNRYFSSVLTQYNPAFIPVNATRDAIFGLTALAAEKGEGTALKVAAHYAQAIWAMQRHTRGVKGNSAYDVWADEFAKAGGQTGYVNMPSIEDITDAIGKGRLGGYSPTGIAKAGRVIADAVGTMNTAVENALRLSTYVELRKQGASQEAAAEYAKNLTVNFNKKGFNGSALNSWFLFYNAALQGAVRSSQVMRKPKTWGYLGAMAAAQVAATMFAMGLRDDDDEPIANKIPDHVKRRNLWFVIPGEQGEHTLVTIPLPYGFNVFPYISGRVTSAMMNEEQKPDETAAELTANSISALIESFMPVPLAKGPVGMLPYPLTIAANVQTNRDDFGRPIRQEDPYAKSDLPRSSIGKPDTMEIFKITAKGLNRLGGGDDETVPSISFLDLAPEDLEYISKALTGGAGKFVIDVAAMGGNVIDPSAPDIGPDGVPIAKRYVTKVDDQAAQRSMYYERRSSIDKATKKLRKIYEAEGLEAAQKYLDTTPALIGARFDTRKNVGKAGQPAGSVILSDGKPKLEVGIQDSPFGKYKAAEKVLSGIRDSIEAQYNAVPASIIPNEKSRKRDLEIRRLEVQAWGTQYDFNKTWNRDVVDDK